MLAERYPSQDILAYFSRPGRLVNAGRISEIRSGTEWADVPAATDKMLRSYIESATNLTPASVILAKSDEPSAALRFINLCHLYQIAVLPLASTAFAPPPSC